MTDRTIRITLVRHGESLANQRQQWQGHGDSPLSPLGCAQAQALAERLASRSFDYVVASDLERASATARALGRPFERERSWREFDLGRWEGLTRTEIAQRYGDQLAQLDAGEDMAPGGGESYAAFCARVDQALARVRARLAAGEHALVVCHGGVIGALVAEALGIRSERDLPIARVFNSALTELSYDAAGAVTVRVFNDALHLGALALFPHPVDGCGALALICDAAPHAQFGHFHAHYQEELHLAQLAGDARLPALLAALHARHPEQRVSLSASAQRIEAWASELLWRDGLLRGRLGRLARGALCHVTGRGGRHALLDYGVSVATS